MTHSGTAKLPEPTRELSRELSIGGIDLPRCTRVNISVYALRHNSHVWGDDHMVRLFKLWKFNTFFLQGFM